MKINIKKAYIFTSRKFGLELVLEHIGVKEVINVPDSDRMKTMERLSRLRKPAETISIFFDDADGVRFIEEIRLKHSVSSPILVVSFTTQERVEKRLTTPSGVDRPIIKFNQGMYHLQLPARIDKLRNIVDSALPVEENEMKKIQEEYTLNVIHKKNADFRHKCKNLASVIRILQGAYYAGDLAKPDYLSAIESIKELSHKISALNTYQRIIEDYIKSVENGRQQRSENIHSSQPIEPTRILLLDDEAVTVGWNIVLDAIFGRRGYSVSFETDREKFIKEVELNELFEFDILLLDLMMPDKPERSVYLIERMNDRHPHIPVIVFSALTDLPYFRKCQEAGAFNYFAKELGSEDRDPEKYYKKLKKLLLDAAVYRDNTLKKYQKGYKNIIDGFPFYHVEKINDSNQYSARFAYRVESVKGIALMQRQKEINSLNECCNRILSWLFRQVTDGKTLSLRLQWHPEEKRMEIVFIGKATGETSQEAHKIANVFSKDLWDFLKEISLYRFAPVKREQEFINIVDNIEIESLFSLRRRKFEITPTSTDSFEWFYPISIMSLSNANLITTVKQMMKLMDTSFIGVTLIPYNNRDIENKISEFERIRNIIPEMHSRDNKLIPEEFSEGLEKLIQAEELNLYNSLPKDLLTATYNDMRSLIHGYFACHFFVASEGSIPGSFLESIRYDYLGADNSPEFIDYTNYKGP